MDFLIHPKGWIYDEGMAWLELGCIVSVLHQNEGGIGKSRGSRPSRCPSGFALGTSLGPREISWSSGMYNPIRQYVPPLGSVRMQYHIAGPCVAGTLLC